MKKQSLSYEIRYARLKRKFDNTTIEPHEVTKEDVRDYGRTHGACFNSQCKKLLCDAAQSQISYKQLTPQINILARRAAIRRYLSQAYIPKYYAVVNGNTYGPYTTKQTLDMFESGRKKPCLSKLVASRLKE